MITVVKGKVVVAGTVGWVLGLAAAHRSLNRAGKQSAEIEDSPIGQVRKRRKMSKESRERIAKAQKLRWAKVRQAQKTKA